VLYLREYLQSSQGMCLPTIDVNLPKFKGCCGIDTTLNSATPAEFYPTIICSTFLVGTSLDVFKSLSLDSTTNALVHMDEVP